MRFRWGEIPGFQGVWATHETLEGCRHELREALSDWIALRLRLGLEIPVLETIDLNQHSGDIEVGLLRRILRQATISREEWLGEV